MNYQGPVRRTDLYLRTVYPDVITTIYQINEQQFLIKCDNVEGDFSKFKEEFNYSIRLIDTSVEVVENTPNEFIQIVPNISDKKISENFEGIQLSKAGLLNLLISKFPNVHFFKIEDGARTATIYTAAFKGQEGTGTYCRFLNNADREKIQQFLDSFKLPIVFTIQEEEVEKPETLKSFDHVSSVHFIYAANFKRNNVSEFSLRDEALWFDNVDKVFEGKYKKKDLFFYSQDEYSCYVDYSIFDNIDIRNHLFLFQTVYLTLPFEKNIESWLKESKIQKNEFLELVKRNRIKVALTQPEFRYDTHFVNEIYAANPNAVITRRALAMLQQIDIVEMSDQYMLKDIEIIKELRKFCEIIGEATKMNPKFIYDLFVWPIRARRDSFEKLNNAGIFSIPAFGVNKAIEKQISDAVKKDLSFEFTTSASSIHLANSLNATYFPFKAQGGYSDAFYANVMGEMLNFYKSANLKTIKSYIDAKDKINAGILPIDPIDIIEINDYISITDLEEVLSKSVVFPNSKRLIESLSGLSDEERKIKIDQYNLEVNKKINKKTKSENAIDLGQNVVMDVAGALTGFTAIGSVFSLAKIGGKKLIASIPLIKNIANKFEEAMHSDTDKANIHYLTKINRVARIKRNL